MSGLSLARHITTSLKGRWYGSYGAVRCPVHDDRSPSLIVRDDEAIGVRVHCYADCDPRDIRAKWRAKGLLANSGERLPTASGRSRHEAEERERRVKIDSAL